MCQLEIVDPDNSILLHTHHRLAELERRYQRYCRVTLPTAPSSARPGIAQNNEAYRDAISSKEAGILKCGVCSEQAEMLLVNVE
jgi:hypothetical protein